METLNCIVPDIDLNLSYKDVMLTNGSSVNYRVWTSSSYSNSNTTFSCPPSSTGVFISRLIVLHLPFVATIMGKPIGTNTDPCVAVPGRFALRAYAADQILNSITMTINNQTFTLQNSEIVGALARFWKTKEYLSFPNYLDNYSVYSEGVGTFNNPLAGYDSSSKDNSLRGCYPLSISKITGIPFNEGCIVSGVLICPVYLPVLVHDNHDSLGFCYVKTMDFVFNWATSNLSRMFSHAYGTDTTTSPPPANNISSISVNLQQTAPALLMRYTTPPANFVYPDFISYGSHDINRFITVANPLPAITFDAVTGVMSQPTSEVTSTNIQLNCIPNYCIIFLREDNQNLTAASTDTAMNIYQISINFDNMSGILSSCREADLWKMSRANDLECNYAQYHGLVPLPKDAPPATTHLPQVGTVGSFLKLNFGKDITLSPNSWVGKVGAYNFSINVQYKQVSSVPLIKPNLYIITASPSKIIIYKDGLIESRLGIAEPAGPMNYISYHKVGRHFFGAGFADWAQKAYNIIKPIHDYVRDNKLISRGAEVFSYASDPRIVAPARLIANTAKRFGYGGEGGDGGRVASREELLRRIKKLA